MKILEITDKGRRVNNEDSVMYIEVKDKFCGVVCDGLGGHDCGEVASQLVCEEVVKGFKTNPIVSETNLGKLILDAQESLMVAKEEKPELSTMMTTITVILADGDQIILGHVGDSRIMLFNKRKLVYQTKDHSVVEALYESGQISTEEKLHHPDRNRLLRAMGMEWDTVKYDLASFSRKNNKITHGVLCTDGFWENISVDELGKIVAGWRNQDKKINKINEIIRNSEYFDDNYSGIIIGF